MEQQQPFFSIIVPTYNRLGQLASCLRSLAHVDYPRDRFEVIVVDDGSSVSPDPVIAPFHSQLDVTLIRQAHRGPAIARNTGAARAHGKFLAFTADDCRTAGDWLRTLAARFASASDCAIGGQIFNSLTGNSYSNATHLLIQYLYSCYNAQPTEAQFFTPNNLTLPAARFRAIGGFDISFVTGTGEDREFCNRWLRCGYPMIYAPEAVVYHAHPLTLYTFCQLHFRYGCGTYRYHLVRAQRESRRIKLEPFRFYLNLLRYPLAGSQGKDRLRLAALLGISQIANAAGFFWEQTWNRKRSREPGLCGHWSGREESDRERR